MDALKKYYWIDNICTYNSWNAIAKKIEDEHTESLRFEDGNQRRVEEVALNHWTRQNVKNKERLIYTIQYKKKFYAIIIS